MCSFVLLLGCSDPVASDVTVDAGLDSGVPVGWEPLCWEHSLGGSLSAPSFCHEGDLHRCLTRDTREVTDCLGAQRCAITAEEPIYADYVCVTPTDCEPHTAHCLGDGTSFEWCREFLWDGAIERGQVTGSCAPDEICVPDATQIRCTPGPASG